MTEQKKRCFTHIAKLIRDKRVNHPKNYSQSELSQLLGYKNGQFISNVERALCNIPLKMLPKVLQILDFTPGELKEAMLRDHQKTLDNYLNSSPSNERVSDPEDTGSEDVTPNTPLAASSPTPLAAKPY